MLLRFPSRRHFSTPIYLMMRNLWLDTLHLQRQHGMEVFVHEHVQYLRTRDLVFIFFLSVNPSTPPTSSSGFSWPVFHGKRHFNTAGRLHVYLFKDIYALKGALKVFAFFLSVPCRGRFSSPDIQALKDTKVPSLDGEHM